ncbi:MAG: 3-deoxy-manno-octulosonate cytidylyltransferase [Oligoflexia bacterium]|nr:3-deoxy-manno-octulosonate cytidylyltransferase [Oligoflexia bacterium]
MGEAEAVVIIPTRLNSSRLPRKALADICGLPMIEHVYRRSAQAKLVKQVLVATDSAEIFDVVTSFGGTAVMTSDRHQTGTDRLAEVAQGLSAPIIINVQGDEAQLNPEYVDRLVQLMRSDLSVEVAMLVNPLSRYGSVSEIKAVLDQAGNIMYMSRSDIPSSARTPNAPLLKCYHVVPFRREFLLEFAAWPPGELEGIEFIEYNRILERGRKIRALKVESDAISVDTPQDLEVVRAAMPQDPIFKSYCPR